METIRVITRDIDLSQPLLRVTNGELLAMHDNEANRFGANVFKDGQEVDLTGYTAKGYFIRLSTETIEIDGVISGNQVYVDLKESCYLYDGSYTFTMKILKGETEITLYIMSGRIAKTDTLIPADDTDVVSLKKVQGEIGDLTKLETENKTDLVSAINEVQEKTKERIPEAVNTALEKAKESGEFDGEKGEKGDKGDKGDPGADGAKGEKGDKGDPGTDANVTTENVIKALGYTPADKEALKPIDFLAEKEMENPESVCIIEDTEASVSANDNSAFFDCENIVVNNDTYKLSKDAVLALENKKLTGKGSVIWNGWSNIGSTVGNSMLNGKIKAKYTDDAVYMSMKMPSDAVHPTIPERVNGSILNYQPSGYSNLINIGAIYAPDAATLPDTFDVCLGKMAVYTLSNAANAKWKIHEQFNVPPGFALYQLPWTSSNDTNYPVSESKITRFDTHIKIQLSKTDLDNKCLHFFGSNSFTIDIPNCVAIVCMFEAWTETAGAEGKIYAAIGADQRNSSGTVKQAFSGRNWNLRTEKRVIIGHNISDTLYDELRDSQNDPRFLLENFGGIDHDARFANALEKHNNSTVAHSDIRQYIKAVEDMLYEISIETVLPINLCDEVYEYGAFSNAGVMWNNKEGVRTKNYIPVQGGRTIEAMYGTNIGFNANSTLLIVQYNASKSVVVEGKRLAVKNSSSSESKTLTLAADTAYIKFYVWLNPVGANIDNVQITVSYAENKISGYVSRSITERMIDMSQVILTSPNGTIYRLSVSDTGELSVNSI
ncbi:collagen-like triple helix repeat-containing protein [Candidatus Proelusimicrobium excrementi]|uniref:collagen-like triple helix repeat-containing protein n=1 Tax=Candidatus Proelusimicrobium excrementi TaxID=3416222 RepID=UPI003CBB9353|nr:collagen-like protein [Elusimicrobiaceae bacterium]